MKHMIQEDYRKTFFQKQIIGWLALVFLLLAMAPKAIGAVSLPFKGQAFKSPEAAVSALIAAVRQLDPKKVLHVLGPDAKDIIFSGDKVQARKGVRKFLEKYDEKHKIELVKPDKAVLFLGKEEWPYPIPLVRWKGKWFFDTKAGREEIVNRRVGANELMAIKVLEAYVEAQLEYASKDRDGDGILEFAQKINSDKGKKNGLYWPAKPEEESSPFGPLVARGRRGLPENLGEAFPLSWILFQDSHPPGEIRAWWRL